MGKENSMTAANREEWRDRAHHSLKQKEVDRLVSEFLRTMSTPDRLRFQADVLWYPQGASGIWEKHHWDDTKYIGPARLIRAEAARRDQQTILPPLIKAEQKRLRRRAGTLQAAETRARNRAAKGE